MSAKNVTKSIRLTPLQRLERFSLRLEFLRNFSHLLIRRTHFVGRENGETVLEKEGQHVV